MSDEQSVTVWPVVSGNRITLTRLDENGQPEGEPFTMGGSATFDLSLSDDGGEEMIPTSLADWKFSHTIEFTDVSPDVMRLLVGLTKWQWRKIMATAWLVRKVLRRG